MTMIRGHQRRKKVNLHSLDVESGEKPMVSHGNEYDRTEPGINSEPTLIDRPHPSWLLSIQQSPTR